MVTYAAYAGADVDLRKVAIVTILGDTAVSLAAGFAIFPIVFAEGLDPASGPGLMFVTLPLAFARIPGGVVAAFGFFLLLIVAAIASGISMLEMPVAALSRRGWSRARATVATAAACWLCGLATVLSFNAWAAGIRCRQYRLFANATVFDLLDHLTSNIMLPFGGFALALFAGWILPARLLAEEIGLSPHTHAISAVSAALHRSGMHRCRGAFSPLCGKGLTAVAGEFVPWRAHRTSFGGSSHPRARVGRRLIAWTSPISAFRCMRECVSGLSPPAPAACRARPCAASRSRIPPCR